MSERLSESSESNRFKISHEEAIKNISVRPKYQRERIDAIKQGRTVLVIRGFEGSEQSFDDSGIVYDLYINGERKGFIDGSEQDGFLLYDFMADEEDPSHIIPHHIVTTDPVEHLSDGERRLTEIIQETHQGF
jgi:hypothetical protein